MKIENAKVVGKQAVSNTAPISEAKIRTYAVKQIGTKGTLLFTYQAGDKKLGSEGTCQRNGYVFATHKVLAKSNITQINEASVKKLLTGNSKRFLSWRTVSASMIEKAQ